MTEQRPIAEIDAGLTQTILATPELVEQGVYGNCMQAAVATVLRKPMDAVPHFGAFAWWPGALRLWLRGEGLDYTVVKAPPIPQGRAMLCGRSPRGYAHAVVSEGGEVVWDPHPSRAGLTVVTGAYVIHEWDPGDAVPTAVDHLMHAEHHSVTSPDGNCPSCGWVVAEVGHDPRFVGCVTPPGQGHDR